MRNQRPSHHFDQDRSANLGSLRPRLKGENEMEWKRMKRIILEYSSIPLFGSFNGGNGKLIPLFGSLSGRK